MILANQMQNKKYRDTAGRPVLGFLVLSFVWLGISSPGNAQLPSQRPNIVFILADDLGWSELGCYGNEFHETPNLDRLASDGMRFSQAYAAAPVCSPYRAALLTGQHPARIGILDYLRPNSANALATSHVTLPEMLQRNGYATGMIGKWHLTGYRFHKAEHELRPKDHGFEWSFGSEIKGVGNGANFWPYVFRDQPIRWLDIPENRLGKEEYLTDRLNLEAVDFIERSAKRGKPFFLYLSHYAPHTILNGRPDLVKKYIRKHPPGKSGRDRCYLCEDSGLGKGDPGHHWAVHHNPHLAAMLESIDHGIGMITRKLKEVGIAENTIVIFTSDNGGETNVTSNAPLRGGKSELYEGGIRVPLIVRWPAQIPAGSLCQHPTQNIDFYPTILDAANIRPDKDHVLDGVSIHKTLKSPAQEIEREFLAWHYPLDGPHFLGGTSGGAIRSGHWKLIEKFDNETVELYSLDKDSGESTNLAAKNPDKVQQLRRQLSNWRKLIGARIPSPPLMTEARQLYFAEHFHPNHLSQRFWYNADWKVENGVLKRIRNGSKNTRIFLRDAEFRDVVVRFDFQIGDAKDVRLMTGSNGHYNTVLHLRPDHFFLQTAMDDSVPYFSYRHGECAYDFKPDKWYTMTVEFLGDEVVAHVDHKHIVYAKHPIIDRQRDYFALQVDDQAACFDNVQVFFAAGKRSEDARAKIKSAIGRYPVPKPLKEKFEIQRSNAHEWYYQNDEAYRSLVKRVDELDEVRKKRFPSVFRTHKEIRKQIQDERKRLLDSDPRYKEMLFASYRAKRKTDDWLIAKKPGLEKVRDDRQKVVIAEMRKKYASEPELVTLIEKAELAQKRLELAYPQLFVSDDEITDRKKLAANTVKESDDFQKLARERADAYSAQQDYLVNTDKELKRLNRLLNERTP